jgi:hypothetical protein
MMARRYENYMHRAASTLLLAGGALVSAAPGPAPPPGFEPCTTRPTIGSNVTVHSSDPASTCSADYLNRFGIISSDDHDSRPYKIRFDGSIASCYFRVSELRCALKQPPPPPGFEPCTTRPTIGSNVTVHSVDPTDSGNCVAEHLNRFGVIYTDDHSGLPYQINFYGVRGSCWFRETEVWCAIHQGPPPPGPPPPCCKEICDKNSCGSTCPICQGTDGGFPGAGCNGCGAGVPCNHCGGTSSCNQTLGMTCDSARLEGLVACGICVGKNYAKLASVGCSEPSYTDAFCRNETCTPSLFAQCKTSRDQGELECATCIGQRDAQIPAVCALPEEQAFCGTGGNSSVCCGTWCRNATNTKLCMGSCSSHVADNCGTYAQYPTCGVSNTNCTGCDPGPGCEGHCDKSC